MPSEVPTTGRPGAGQAGTGQPLRTADEVLAAARALPPHSPEVRLSVESLDLVRALTLVDPSVTVDRLVLTVTEWERPTQRWSGRLGRVSHVLSCAVDYPVTDVGPAGVDLRLTRPTALSDAARGVFPLLGVDRALPGAGLVEVGTLDLPATALALLPTRTAPGIAELPSHHLEGLGLGMADLGLVGTTETLERLRAAADDPAEVVVHDAVLVDPSGHLAVGERLDLPLVDLHVHNPVNRVRNLVESAGSLLLTAEDGVLALRPPGPRRRPAGWSRPLGQPLTAQEVRRLRDIEAIDLSGLDLTGLRPGADEAAIYRRLAELAATGVILHSMPAGFARADDVLGPTLAGLLRSPYTLTTGLVRELRSVPQRREAMQRFGGFFELADHAARSGHRLLPTVSVVLSSMRPARAVRVLEAVAAQRYPHVEVVLALHGVEGPLDPALEAAVRACDATVLRRDASTAFGSVLAEAARHSTGDLVVKLDDDDVYGPRVVEDLVLAYLYSGADLVGKTTEFLYFEDIDHTAHRTFHTEIYHYQVAGGTMMLSRAALDAVGGWRPTPHSTDRSVLIRVGAAGGIGYRTHSLGYVYVRHLDGHTWRQSDSRLLRKSPEQWPRFMPEIVET